MREAGASRQEIRQQINATLIELGIEVPAKSGKGRGQQLSSEQKAMVKQLLAEGTSPTKIRQAIAELAIIDSAVAAAVGYSQESNIPYGEGLLKNRYVGRTFIQPDQRLREMGVRLKFNPLKEMLEGKRIIVVDDSIVRGTTTPHVIKLLKKSGAKEVHFRVCAPPIMWPCHFGVDLATRKELVAANYTVEQIREFVGADTLGYLSHEGLLKAVNKSKSNYCMACFTGDYPVPVQLEMDKLALET